jgi:hypothetical protein
MRCSRDRLWTQHLGSRNWTSSANRVSREVTGRRRRMSGLATRAAREARLARSCWRRETKSVAARTPTGQGLHARFGPHAICRPEMACRGHLPELDRPSLLHGQTRCAFWSDGDRFGRWAPGRSSCCRHRLFASPAASGPIDGIAARPDASTRPALSEVVDKYPRPSAGASSWGYRSSAAS